MESAAGSSRYRCCCGVELIENWQCEETDPTFGNFECRCVWVRFCGSLAPAIYVGVGFLSGTAGVRVSKPSCISVSLGRKNV
jgi:hypothetical protein